jgi:hypothetical protein
LILEVGSQRKIREQIGQAKFCDRSLMRKLQPGDEIVKIDEEQGIAWILLPPDPSLGGFQGISPRIKDEEKFMAAKKKSEKE